MHVCILVLFNDFALYTYHSHITPKILGVCSALFSSYFSGYSLLRSLFFCLSRWFVYVPFPDFCVYIYSNDVDFLFSDYIIIICAALPLLTIFHVVRCFVIWKRISDVCVYKYCWFSFVFLYSRFGTELDCYNPMCLSIKICFCSENKRNWTYTLPPNRNCFWVAGCSDLENKREETKRRGTKSRELLRYIACQTHFHKWKPESGLLFISSQAHAICAMILMI